jgi:hypothetical protein
VKRSIFALSCWFLAPSAFAILDTNNNGLSDLWEKEYNAGELFSEAFDPQLDYDKDGWTNAQEAAAGTNPFDPNPPDGTIRPGIVHTPAVWGEENGVPYIDTPEAVTVSWPTIPGKRYQLLVSADLSQGSWIEVPNSDFISNGGNIPEFHFTTAESEKLFWRVAVTDIDTDGDGLTDAEERQIGSSPYLADTDGDGIDDSEALTSGLDPSGNGSDLNADGIPDNELYSVVFEVQAEYRSIPFSVGYESYESSDTTHRYYTMKNTEIYSVSDSPSYTDVTDGQHVRTSTYLVNGQIPDNGQPVISEEGVFFSEWKGSHSKSLGEDETVHRETTVRSVVGPTITGTQFKTVTTDTTPWTVKKNGAIVRSGTEIITVTQQTDLCDETTYPEFWTTHVKSRPWQELQPYECGPNESMDFLRAILGDAEAAEMIRNQFLNHGFSIFGTVSDPGRTFADHGSDIRIKSLRWRWVRFNPRSPFGYEYATPPASLSRTFHLLVTQHDYLGPYLTSGGSQLDETTTKGIVEIKCNANEGSSYWQPVSLEKFDPYKLEDPTVLDSMDFSKVGWSRVSFGNLPVPVQKRIPDIADDGGPTTYSYQTVHSVPRETPLPGVEIIEKDIDDDQITLSVEIYDALSDVAESTPKVWVNSREQTPTAGDKSGVFRLQDHVYQLYPGRNEITVAVENTLGGRGSESIVVEGDNDQGYQIVGEPARAPLHPTYPLVLQIQPGYENLPADRSVTLTVAEESVELTQGTYNDDIPASWFRSKPFLSACKPSSATPDQVAALPGGKPVFLSELEDDLSIGIESSEWTTPAEWTVIQSGVELVSPKSVDVQQTGSLTPSLEFKVRGLGEAPYIKAVLTTYKDDETEQEVTSAFTTAYQTAYIALAPNAKNDPVTFTADDFEMEEGFNGLSFEFANSATVRHGGSYHSFRFPAPTQAGVRVFSANRVKDTVLEGVSGRMGDIWYPIEAEADLTELADALAASGCHIVGMTDLNEMFDDFPLKRSFLVRGPPGRTFQAFDDLYVALGREQRSQTFETDGTHGASLAGELNRVQTDADLPTSAKNALALEIAGNYQFHNGFEDFVPKTHQPFVDPGTGILQPNSWTMRGSSLPDHVQSNPTPWTVTNTLSDPARAASASGIIKLDTTGEDTAYYASTSATAPWDLSGARAVALRFKLLEHDATNGTDGAFQLAAGDGTRTWTCKVSTTQVDVQGTTIALPAATLPSGLIDGKFHTLQINLSGTGNDAIVSVDGEILTATATAQTGTHNGIAFGDPGAGIAGKLEVETLQFENSDLRYQYGYVTDDYADSDEIDEINNVLLYIRSKGQAFRVSPIARWVRILDPDVHEWLLDKYTGQSKLGYDKELHILANKDVWLGSTVAVSESETYASRWPWAKKTKVTSTLALDKEETKIWSTDQTRNEMQLAGILMAWCYEQVEYRQWLAQRNGQYDEIILIDKKHLVDNISKCAKRVETTLELGGEIAISMTNEFADYAITLNYVRQGDYMAMVGFIPLVPSSTAKAFKFFNKADGATIEAIHQLSTKLDDFPGGKHEYPNVNLPGDKRILDFEKIFANADDAEAVVRARKLTTSDLIPNSSYTGHKLLDTFSNSNVSIFKTKQPVKAYRCFSSNPNISEFGASGGFLMFEKPIHRNQVEVDYALGKTTEGFFLKNADGSSAYDRYVEVEIPEGVYVYMGYAADQGGIFKGGGTQMWIDDTVRDSIDWNIPWSELPQY